MEDSVVGQHHFRTTSFGGNSVKTIVKTLAVSALLLNLSACATITRGEHTAWEVNTNPVGATVKTTNGFFCDSTPCSLRMMRKSEFTATISKPGYKTLEVRVTNKVSGSGGAGMAGNVLVGGIIGAGVDVATGAMLDLTPNPLNVSLEKDDGPPHATTAASVAAPAAPDATAKSDPATPSRSSTPKP